ncbi:S-adenosyl-L-methionine-dependent methyltransferase, partial [Lojkania enalia]
RAKHIDSQTTYGEQSPSFISAMLNEFQVSSTSSFVDLGSGVGNVVLQAYLESGCQALGCELDVERHQAATALQRAVEAALSLPPKGISSRDMGTTAELQRAVSLVQGDIFVERETVTRVRTADLIFCDNIKFGPELVRRQVDAVLEQMKSWSVLVSLERVVRGTRKYCRETLSRCGVTEERRVSERGAVSWTDKPIEYWIYR